MQLLPACRPWSLTHGHLPQHAVQWMDSGCDNCRWLDTADMESLDQYTTPNFSGWGAHTTASAVCALALALQNRAQRCGTRLITCVDARPATMCTHTFSYCPPPCWQFDDTHGAADQLGGQVDTHRWVWWDGMHHARSHTYVCLRVRVCVCTDTHANGSPLPRGPKQ